MRALLPLALVSLLACAPEPQAPTTSRHEATPRSAQSERRTPKPEAEPVATTAAQAPAPAAATDSCPSREVRLAHAKETISAWHARAKEMAPIIKFVQAHKCEVKDTSGSVLVTRTKEAGGTRVAVKRGHENEIMCNVPESQWPAGLDAEALATIQLWDDIGEEDKLVDFGANCRDASLEVTYGDFKKQKAILALP